MKRRANALISLIIAYALAMAFVFFSILGPSYQNSNFAGQLLSKAEAGSGQDETVEEAVGTTALLISDSGEVSSWDIKDGIAFLLSGMRIGFNSVDIEKDSLPDPSCYKKLIINISDLSRLDTLFDSISSYVDKGGSLLFIRPPHIRQAAAPWQDLLGIKRVESETASIDTIRPNKSFMIGGGQNYRVNSNYDIAMKASLYGDTDILATTADADIPIIWQRKEKDGRIVVLNFPDYGKQFRGIYAAAISCLGDYCAYPVIDSSTYFLDDFPSPVPSTRSEKLTKEYGLTYDKFLSDVWWPEVTALAAKHDIRYTGMIIESYSNDTVSPFPRNQDTDSFSYYGNMLLADGGELGIHGYNHQPLCLPDFSYTITNGYSVWPDISDITASLNEVTSFSRDLFTGTDISTYVPPSNILSDEARELLGEGDYGIRTICSVYDGNGEAYEQEFTVSPDGIVEAPRIVSGELISDYQKLMAMSELNFHYVNTHFMHPDDILDSDRTGEFGWETCYRAIDSYMTWVDETAPGIRNMTASGLSGAVQRYSKAVPVLTDQGDSIVIRVANFVDEAYIFLRINNGREPAKTKGGKLTKLTDSLYLLECNKENISISFK